MKTTYGTLDIPGDPTPWVTVQPHDDKTWCVLWLQGWTSSVAGHIEGVQRMAENSRMPFAILDYAGHGDHPMPIENSTRAQQLDEIIAAYDQLKADGYRNIIVVGGSFGGYMAALLSAQRDLYALILRAPAIYDDAEFHEEYKDTVTFSDREKSFAYRSSINAESNSAALSAIKNFPRSVYVMEHQFDRTIPKNVPFSYFSVAQQGNYLVVPKTEHSPKLMPEPQKHFAYVEHLTVSLIKAVQLEMQLNY